MNFITRAETHQTPFSSLLLPRVKIGFSFIFVSFLCVYLGQLVDERQGLLWGLAIALSVNAIIFFYGEWRLSAFEDYRLIEGTDPYGYLALASSTAEKIRTRIPQVYLCEKSAPEIFVSGHLLGRCKIHLSSGLYHHLSAPEREALFLRCMLIFKENLFLNLNLTSALIDLSFFGGEFLDKIVHFLFLGKSTKNQWYSHPFSTLAGWLALPLSRLTWSHRDIMRLDRATVSHLQDPLDLARALIKLDSFSASFPSKIAPGLSPLFMVNPLPRQGSLKLFDCYPRLKTRILFLAGHFPI